MRTLQGLWHAYLFRESRPVAIEVYSDKTTYYVDGDMYAKVEAMRYEANLLDEYPYK